MDVGKLPNHVNIVLCVWLFSLTCIFSICFVSHKLKFWLNSLHDPHDALVSSIHKLVYESKMATKLAHQQGKSREMDVCIAKFEDSIDSLKKSLKSLPGLNVNLLAAMNEYVACDDAFSESKVINPIDKIDAFLCEMAVNSIYLSGYIHWRRAWWVVCEWSKKKKKNGLKKIFIRKF